MFSVNSPKLTSSASLPAISPRPDDDMPLPSLPTRMVSAGNPSCLSGGHSLKRPAEAMPAAVPAKRHTMARAQSAPAGYTPMQPTANGLAQQMSRNLQKFVQDADGVQQQLNGIRRMFSERGASQVPVQQDRNLMIFDQLATRMENHINELRKVTYSIDDANDSVDLSVSLCRMGPCINDLIEMINKIEIVT